MWLPKSPNSFRSQDEKACPPLSNELWYNGANSNSIFGHMVSSALKTISLLVFSVRDPLGGVVPLVSSHENEICEIRHF